MNFFDQYDRFYTTSQTGNRPVRLNTRYRAIIGRNTRHLREPFLAGFRLERVVFAETAFGGAATAFSTCFRPLPSASETRPTTKPAAAEATTMRARARPAKCDCVIT
jgi:hypothetical protein